ncbi:MAG: pilus assembly protein N-terminal domain-containing protein [Vicinamibacterales bacterium]
MALAALLLGAVAIGPDDALGQMQAGRTIIKAQHVRLPFTSEIRRIAVGDTEILSADLITSREVLLLGRETGRTSLIVWFTDGTVRELLISVQRDFSILSAALKRLDPSIDVESAPDCDALILTGLVPTLTVSQTAEQVVRNYLDAGETRRGAARPLMAARPAPVAVPPPDGVTIPPDSPEPGATPTPRTDAAQIEGTAPAPNGTVINLIRLQQLPPLPEERSSTLCARSAASTSPSAA